MNTRSAKIVNNIAESLCYYRINPYDLMCMEYTSQEDLSIFERIYMTRAEIKNNVFNRISVIYNKLVSEYHTSLMNEMENELEELSTFFEDKMNVFTLSTLNDINYIDIDIRMIIYNNIISTEGDKKYKHIINELEKYGRLENKAHILAV
jgi:hypothetical protein